jgi:hypothetical protein
LFHEPNTHKEKEESLAIFLIWNLIPHLLPDISSIGNAIRSTAAGAAAAAAASTPNVYDEAMKEWIHTMITVRQENCEETDLFFS